MARFTSRHLLESIALIALGLALFVAIPKGYWVEYRGFGYPLILAGLCRPFGHARVGAVIGLALFVGALLCEWELFRNGIDPAS